MIKLNTINRKFSWRTAARPGDADRRSREHSSHTAPDILLRFLLGKVFNVCSYGPLLWMWLTSRKENNACVRSSGTGIIYFLLCCFDSCFQRKTENHRATPGLNIKTVGLIICYYYGTYISGHIGTYVSTRELSVSCVWCVV